MRIATYNVNGINGRLPNLLRWLEEAAPDIVCLQELKAPDEKFPDDRDPRRRLRRDLARPEELERRRDPRARRRADGDPPRLARRSRRHAQPLHRGGDRRHHRRLPLSAERQSGARARNSTTSCAGSSGCTSTPRACSRAAQPVVLAGDYNVMPTDLDVYTPERWVDDALFRPEVREAYRRLVEQGWTDALRALHPDERIYTFWDYFRNAFARDAGSAHRSSAAEPAAGEASQPAPASTARCAAARKPSDHAPAWIELSDRSSRRGTRRRA